MNRLYTNYIEYIEKWRLHYSNEELKLELRANQRADDDDDDEITDHTLAAGSVEDRWLRWGFLIAESSVNKQKSFWIIVSVCFANNSAPRNSAFVSPSGADHDHHYSDCVSTTLPYRYYCQATRSQWIQSSFIVRLRPSSSPDRRVNSQVPRERKRRSNFGWGRSQLRSSTSDGFCDMRGCCGGGVSSVQVWRWLQSLFRGLMGNVLE